VLYPSYWRATNRPRTKASPIAGPKGWPVDGAAALRALVPRLGFLPSGRYKKDPGLSGNGSLPTFAASGLNGSFRKSVLAL
jgi:hypothetical protein